MDIIDQIILDKVNFKIENDKIYNFLEKSTSSEFYNELFSQKDKHNEKPDLYKELKKKSGTKWPAYKIMDEIMLMLEKILPDNAVVIEIGGGVFQHRSSNAYKRFENYFPLDISYSSIKAYSENFDRIGFVGNAQKLPFQNKSIDCIFTHTFLEHPIEPELVLREIERVLKPGGIVVHNDAWFCRWWHKYGIVGLKSFANMTNKEKLIWLAAKISEIKLFRIPPIILRRVYVQLFNFSRKNIGLKYKKIKPNYELFLGCDEDAASSIDPIDVIRFYESRNFYLLQKLSGKERMFFPNKYIALRKKTEVTD